MDINIAVNEDVANVDVVGKITVQTSPELEAAINQLDPSVQRFDINLAEVSYISSAGLRVLVGAEKLAASRGGSMRLIAPRDEVYEVFEMTGLSEIFTIER